MIHRLVTDELIRRTINVADGCKLHVPRRAIRRRAAAFPSGHRGQDEPDEEKPDGIFSVCAPVLQRATRM